MPRTMVAFRRADGVYFVDVDRPQMSPRLLVQGEKEIGEFVVAPTGRQVALTYREPYPRDLYVTDIGGQPRKVADRAGQSFSWSPDSQWLVYQRLRPVDEVGADGVRRIDVADDGIHVVRADGGEHRRLLPLGQRYFSPTWSPDGREIFFFHAHRPGCCGGTTEGDTHAIPVGGGMPRIFARDLALVAWSHDGQRALMARPRDGQREFYLVSRDGQQRTPVGKGYAAESSAIWLPDGSGVAVGTHTQAWLVDGSGRRMIVGNIVPDHYTPLLTLDGTRVLFLRAVGSPDGLQLRVVALDGGEDRLIAEQVVSGSVQVFAAAEDMP